MTEFKELPQHDGAWERGSPYCEAVYESAGDAINEASGGEIVVVELFSTGPTIYGFQVYDEEADEFRNRWFDNEHEAKMAFAETKKLQKE